MRRVWSIGVRTALVFAAASMVLVAGVLVFVNIASQWSLRSTTFEIDPDDGPIGAATGGATAAPDPDWQATPQDGASIVSVVAHQQWQWSVVAVAVAGLLAGLVGWIVSRRMLRPIDHITSTADRISASNLHERIALQGPDDELRRLSRTVDALLDRLEAAFASQRRFIAQASHELRTPLAVQRAALQIDLEDKAGPADVARVRATLLEQNRRTERLVGSLLMLAEAERGLDDAGEPVDLPTLLEEVAAGYLDPAERAQVDLCVETDVRPAAPVVVEPVLAHQLVANLVDNAVEYNVLHGSVWVRSTRSGFVVENTGQQVDPEDVPGLLAPFRRATCSGSGRHSGLGLSIVAAIAEAHGWRLDVAARAAGGLVVRVDVSSVQPAVTARGNTGLDVMGT